MTTPSSSSSIRLVDTIDRPHSSTPSREQKRRHPFNFDAEPSERPRVGARIKPSELARPKSITVRSV